MSRFGANVLMVGTYESYLSRSVREGLGKRGINVVFSNGDMQNLKENMAAFQLFIIFSDEELCSNMQFLVYLKDMAIEKDVPIFLIGYSEENNMVAGMIPEYLIERRFLRPINANEVEQEIEQFLDQNPAFNRKKILVVDDSATDLRSMKSLLGEKYQVILASSGMSAIVYLSQEHPDLILLDYEMPVVNGKQVLEMIRSESDYSKTPVIFLTAKGDKKSIMDVINLHPDGYLLKSMELGLIKKAIDDFFERRKSLGISPTGV